MRAIIRDGDLRRTTILWLRHCALQVAPGEVDTNLEDEVGTECTVKYGAVRGVMIFEVTQPGFPPELAVRIFVAFERQEDATKVRDYALVVQILNSKFSSNRSNLKMSQNVKSGF